MCIQDFELWPEDWPEKKENRLDYWCLNLQEIPKEAFSFPNLKSLSLNECVIKELQNNIAYFKRLENLELYLNGLVRLSDNFGALSNLIRLNLEFNDLNALPASFSKLNNLKYLNLSKNKFDVLPKSIFENKVLKVLDLSRNELSQFNLPHKNRLTSLDVSENDLCGFEMNHLKHLKYLNLSGNNLEHFIINGNSFALTHLNLSYNKLRDLPSNLNILSELTYLRVQSNNIQSATEISQLTKLENLFIDLDLISVNLLTQLKSLKKVYCNIDEKQLSIQKPHELNASPSLEVRLSEYDKKKYCEIRDKYQTINFKLTNW